MAWPAVSQERTEQTRTKSGSGPARQNRMNFALGWQLAMLWLYFIIPSCAENNCNTYFNLGWPLSHTSTLFFFINMTKNLSHSMLPHRPVYSLQTKNLSNFMCCFRLVKSFCKLGLLWKHWRVSEFVCKWAIRSSSWRGICILVCCCVCNNMNVKQDIAEKESARSAKLSEVEKNNGTKRDWT